MTTQNKIALFFTVIVVLIFTVFGFVFYGYVLNDFESRQTIKILKNVLEEDTLEEIRDRHDHVTILHNDGQVFCSKGIFRKIKNPSLLHNTLYSYGGETYFIATKHLADGTEVCVAEKVTEMKSEINRWLKIYIFLSLAFSILTYFIGKLFAYAVLSPIRTINEHSQIFKMNGSVQALECTHPPKDDIDVLTHTLNELFQRVSEEKERLSRFSSDVSHEFKNALFEIRSTLDLTKKKENYCEGIQKVQKRIDGLDELIESLLMLGKIHSENIPMHDVNLYETIQQLPIIEDHSGSPKIHITGDSKNILGNDQLLRIAFTNLIGNAIKFTTKEKNIYIHISAKNIKIQDEGIGMNTKEIRSMWDRFYKSNSSREYGSGHGLGLSITREIIEKVHGWGISVQSKKGSGTTFTISFSPKNKEKKS